MTRIRALARALLDWAVARRIGGLRHSERFGALRRSARQWAPVLGRLGIDPTPLDRPRLREEHALRRLMWTASRLGYTFDPIITIDGETRIAEAHAAGRGLLLCTAHCPLNSFVARLADACEIPVTALQIAPEPGVTNLIVGRGGRRHDTIRTSSRTFFEMRAMWRRGGAVLATIDGPRTPRARTHVLSNSGEFFLTYSSVDFALRLGIPILFFATTMTAAGEIRLQIERPADCDGAGHEGRLDSMAEAFLAFLARQTTARLTIRDISPSH